VPFSRSTCPPPPPHMRCAQLQFCETAHHVDHLHTCHTTPALNKQTRSVWQTVFTDSLAKSVPVHLQKLWPLLFTWGLQKAQFTHHWLHPNSWFSGLHLWCPGFETRPGDRPSSRSFCKVFLGFSRKIPKRKPRELSFIFIRIYHS
jgi:hypothetical protein